MLQRKKVQTPRLIIFLHPADKVVEKACRDLRLQQMSQNKGEQVMSSFTVKTTTYLRNLYNENRTLAYKDKRADAKATALQKADESALRKGIRSLADWDYDDDEKNEEEVTKGRFYSTLKAFTGAYNYTINSGTATSASHSVKQATKAIKSLTDSYADTLSAYGVSVSSDGYLSLSDSAVDNIDIKNFKKVFGSDSDYMKELTELSKKASRRIDAYA